MLCLLAVGVVAIGQQRVPARKIREGEFSNAESAETKFPALSRRICHQADSSTVVRRFFRGTASLYIFSILFSRKSRVPSGRGFFVSILIHPWLAFSSTGIISTVQIHLYLALLYCRDYFFRPDSSPACFFVPQGLFLPLRCISILLFFTAGITSSARIHLYLALFHHRDYFRRPDSSLSCSFSPQGLLRPPGFIPSLLFFSTGIISAARIHLYLALLCCRDYFRRPASSPACFFHHRDYCDRPDSSPACSFPPQGLLRPPGFIPGWLFSPQGLFLPPGFISILLLRAAGIISDCDDPP